MEEEKKSPSFLYSLYQRYKASMNISQKSPDSPVETATPETAMPITAVSEAAPPITAASEAAPVPAVSAQAAEKPPDPLFELYSLWVKESPDSPQISTPSALESYMTAPIAELPALTQYAGEIAKFIQTLSMTAKIVCDKITVADNLYRLQIRKYTSAIELADPKLPEPIKPTEPPPLDSTVKLCFPEGKMQALLFVFPPYHGGKDINADSVALALKNNHITYGINQPIIDNIINRPAYFQIFQVACGDYMIPGKPGEIIHLINCNSEVNIKEDDRGNVDFKNLNVIHTVAQGEAICELVPPIQGICGKDICGKALMTPTLKMPATPMGKNTALSEDGSKLISAIDGRIVFQGNRYQVDPVLIIKDNVDYSIGNLDFPGDIIVNGDVCNGFQVKAQGNVTVRGMVESASIFAGGDVSIQKGMNGNQTGLIDARGSVKSSFLENCTVYSGGSITAGSIVACTVYCEDSVYVQGGKGVIIGGSITAYRTVEARMIGSKSRRITSIILGEMPRLLTKKNEIQAKLLEINGVVEKLDKNIHYLEKFMNTLPDDKRIIFTQLVEQKTLYLEQKLALTTSLEQLNNEDIDYSDCFVKSSMVFPVTKLSIGSETFVVEDTVLSKCNFFFANETICQGIL